MKEKAEFTKNRPMTEKSFTDPISLLEEKKTGNQRNLMTFPSLHILLMKGPGLELTSPGTFTGTLNT